MHRHNRQLSQAEKAKDLDILRQLRAQGVDVGELEDEERALDIQLGSPVENFIFDMRAGWSAHYACRVRLVAKVPNVIISDCEITSEFDQDIILETTSWSKGSVFDFCGKHFLQKQILNDRIEDGLRFSYRGQIIEGWVLASGIKPIPEEFRNNAFAALQLSFCDSLERTVQVQTRASVLRSSRPPEEIPESDKGLYAGPLPGLDLDEEMSIRYLETLAWNEILEETGFFPSRPEDKPPRERMEAIRKRLNSGVAAIRTSPAEKNL